MTADARRSPLVSLDSTRSIAVGSTNPVKISAVRAVLGTLARAAVIEGVAVASTVSDQPFGDDETIRGALARAAAAREALGAELGVGLKAAWWSSPMVRCARARGRRSSIVRDGRASAGR